MRVTTLELSLDVGVRPLKVNLIRAVKKNACLLTIVGKVVHTIGFDLEDFFDEDDRQVLIYMRCETNVASSGLPNLRWFPLEFGPMLSHLCTRNVNRTGYLLLNFPSTSSIHWTPS